MVCKPMATARLMDVKHMVGRCKKKNSFWPEWKGACTSKGVLREPQDRGSAEVALYRLKGLNTRKPFWLKDGRTPSNRSSKVRVSGFGVGRKEESCPFPFVS